MRVNAKIAIVEMMINVSSIGHNRFQVMKPRSFQTMTAEVVMANRPESVVASPYVGRKNGSIVMIKMPKPKPVVRCTKLAPMLSRNMAMTRLLILIIPKSFCKDNNNSAILAKFATEVARMGCISAKSKLFCARFAPSLQKYFVL